jgi:myo-inositol catabolism protein IolC
MQHQSPEVQALRIQFQKMVTQAPENQKDQIREIKKFMLDTIKKVEAIRKKTQDTGVISE